MYCDEVRGRSKSFCCTATNSVAPLSDGNQGSNASGSKFLAGDHMALDKVGILNATISTTQLLAMCPFDATASEIIVP